VEPGVSLEVYAGVILGVESLAELLRYGQVMPANATRGPGLPPFVLGPNN
jgi:hypothetical protein